MSLNKYTIKHQKGLSRLLTDNKIGDFEKLSHYLSALPYGRNSNREDLSLIVKENRGTCSSKHAFFKAVAIENQYSDIQLILAIYKMNLKNTPGIGDAILEANLDHIPEAHCYIKIGNQAYDFTTPGSTLSRIESEILYEEIIEPNQVGKYKVDFHERFLRKWISEVEIPYSFEKIWSLRESCIESLSTQTPNQ